MCAFTDPGRSVTLLGPKTDLYLGFADYDSSIAESVRAMIQRLSSNIPTHLLDTFLTITLTPGNPIMHPSIMYGAFGPHSQWDGKPIAEKPLFYEECSELSAYFLQRCDDEVQLIKNKIQVHRTNKNNNTHMIIDIFSYSFELHFLL